MSDEPMLDFVVANAHVVGGDYRAGMEGALSCLAKFITKKNLNTLLYRKLEIDNPEAAEAHYLQAAVELAVCAHFAKSYPEGFLYEPKLNPPKDVDCAFTMMGHRFNIEVKCADYSQQHIIQSSEGFRFDSLGRLTEFDELFSMLGGVFASGPEPKQLHCLQNMDNKLKDYLVSAHEKFPIPSELSELNVLVVCCDDEMDMQKWFSYMYSTQGLFTDDSFVSPESYSKVDVVVLSNIYHRHWRAAEKNLITNHWDFSEAFNILCYNPSRSCDQNLIDCFESTFRHYTADLIDHGEREGDYPLFMKRAFLIPDFVVTQLYKNNIYLFQPRI